MGFRAMGYASECRGVNPYRPGLSLLRQARDRASRVLRHIVDALGVDTPDDPDNLFLVVWYAGDVVAETRLSDLPRLSEVANVGGTLTKCKHCANHTYHDRFVVKVVQK